ncbi:respiratory nitrate reductase chaperone NarJ [Saccharicrinis carchari]|uniref:Respiratory nitrate reductase chaperone NarJ n=1 Tax=Saccharicrinis carchari TaxID=1168039 RepID=A0A521C4Z8_SACCC|nr:nitrate reductase molybdenum cofactor assembly chaperone [Saccharicrinis carchari]SMO54587.1 respiratory nitrate reductase chaperone NarJ [Saccharicrinis carchari]
MTNLNHYTALAQIFSYPSSDRRNAIQDWQKIVAHRVPEMAPKLEAFVEHVENKTIASQQEYYIATFDVQAMCYLDIGYVLYGEDYNRGVFLVNMKQEQKNADNDCGHELPDHLPNMLTLLPKLKDEVFAEELVYSVMIPALEKMIDSFRSDDNVYKGMLQTLLKIMEHDYPESEFERFNFSTQQKAKSFECLAKCGKG